MNLPQYEELSISSPDILEYPSTKRILSNLKKYNLLTNFTPVVLNSVEESKKMSFDSALQKPPFNHPVALGKKRLHLTTQPGTLVKQCPGTNDMLCCHYHIINMVSNCPFDCSYCYLQTYLNQPLTTFYVNEDDIYKQVEQLCNRPPVAQLRIGTGELSDSLALDPITEYSIRLIEITGRYENVRLELKTKSKHVEHLLRAKKKDHVVIGWSMNPAEIIEKEEHGTARFLERVNAAILAAEAGFGVAFHFDPMIYVENWKEIYSEAVDTLLKAVPNQQIRWISLGALRYLPQLKPIALKRRPDTTLFFEESVKSEDGKVRYLRQTRTEMFAFLNEKIKNHCSDILTYLCMESKPVWEKALGRLPDRGF
ncbi:MAG: radical SAM protein [Bacteriovoracia bacterium]